MINNIISRTVTKSKLNFIINSKELNMQYETAPESCCDSGIHGPAAALRPRGAF